MRARFPLVLTAIVLAGLLLAIPRALPSRPTIAIRDLVADTSLLPDPWSGFPLKTETVDTPYSYGSMRNVSASWALSEGLWPYFGEWILEYRSPMPAAIAFNVSISLATRSEPGIKQYDPHWDYLSEYADQARIGCTDVGTGVPIKPEICKAQLRYGQYIVLVTMSQPPVDRESFLRAVALVDQYVGVHLESN